MKKIIDKILAKFGLIRLASHIAALEGNDKFMRKLGQAAKEAGAVVLLDDEQLTSLTLDSDVFILGQCNVLRDCDVYGTINAAPRCMNNLIMGVRHFPKAGEQQ